MCCQVINGEKSVFYDLVLLTFLLFMPNKLLFGIGDLSFILTLHRLSKGGKRPSLEPVKMDGQHWRGHCKILCHAIASWIYGHALPRNWIICHDKRYSSS